MTRAVISRKPSGVKRNPREFSDLHSRCNETLRAIATPTGVWRASLHAVPQAVRLARDFPRDFNEINESREPRVIDLEPSEEQQLIVDTVRQFAENEVRPAARDCDESAKLPGDVLSRAHELGLVANALPSEHGGGGERSAVTAALVIEQLAWGDLAIALAALSPALVALPVADFGSAGQQRRSLPAYAGDRFVPGSLALVEPHFGADPGAPATRAERRGSDFVLRGRKCLVPWQDGGTELIVSATTDEGPRAFLVPRDAPGLLATPEHNMGIRALPTVELELSGVRIPADALLGGDDAPVRAVLQRGRVALAAAAVGVARAAFETARDYAKERHAFGGPIAAKQAIAFKLADMAIEIDGARLLTWEAAWRLDQGIDTTREVALAHRQAQRVALEVADGAVQVLGGHGYIREYLPEMHLRNARGFACFEALCLV
jgi:alkylation response protein AidB-like acyl-CoA dehydrogenase